MASHSSAHRRVIGPLIVDTRAKQVMCSGRPVEVTAMEFAVLSALSEHPGWVIDSPQMSSAVSSYEHYSNAISVHVAHLRQKLKACYPHPLIETVRGLGYRLVVEEYDHGEPRQEATCMYDAAVPQPLRMAIQTAAEGSFQSVLMTGASGSGKTAALHRVRESLTQNGWRAAVVDCRVTQSAGGLAPWRLLFLSLGLSVEASRLNRKRLHDIAEASSAVAEVIGTLPSDTRVFLAFDSADEMDAHSLGVLAHIAANPTPRPTLLVVSGRNWDGRLSLFGAHALHSVNLTPGLAGAEQLVFPDFPEVMTPSLGLDASSTL